MNRNFVLFGVLGVVLCCAQQGNAHYHHDYVVVERPVVVARPAPVIFVNPAPAPMVVVDESAIQQEPPALIFEQMTPSPGLAYTWVGGYWKWNGGWKWKSGRWELRPAGVTVWEQGRWERGHHGWVWKEGHWH
jgi:hypothetical protein